MIKLCCKSIARPLSLIFHSILNGVFPVDWEKSNIVPCHKKDSKNLIKNYRPISPLPIFSKVFERCVAQLLSITHEIYNSFSYNPSTIRL